MNDKFQAVIIGEVLFDVFEDGQAVLGGAPFNVAWHLQGFAQAPLFISRIGQDQYAQQIRTTVQQWGMDSSAIQTDSQYATGMVKVMLNRGQPVFDICRDVAYDHIDPVVVGEVLGTLTTPLVYHGSLAARSRQVYDCIQLCRRAAGKSFVDINLRAPWWDRATVTGLIRHAEWLKVNDAELMTLSGVGQAEAELINGAKALCQDHDIGNLIVTRGEHGAFLVNGDGVVHAKSVSVVGLQDTVGAGDAFSAVCILGILHDWPPDVMLARATQFAAEICRQRGATRPDYKLYDAYKLQWQLA